MALAGGNACIKGENMMRLQYEHLLTYHAHRVREGDNRKKWCQNRHNSLHRFGDSFTSSDILCFILQKLIKVLDRVATLELQGKRVFG